MFDHGITAGMIKKQINITKQRVCAAFTLSRIRATFFRGNYKYRLIQVFFGVCRDAFLQIEGFQKMHVVSR